MGGCITVKSVWALGKTFRQGKFLCLSFSFCLTRRLIVSVQLKFSKIAEKWAFSIIVEICVEDFQMAFGVPDPWYFTACLGGQLHIMIESQCQSNWPIERNGGAYLRLDIEFGIRLRIIGVCVRLTINVASIELASTGVSKAGQSLCAPQTGAIDAGAQIGDAGVSAGVGGIAAGVASTGHAIGMSRGGRLTIATATPNGTSTSL